MKIFFHVLIERLPPFLEKTTFERKKKDFNYSAHTFYTLIMNENVRQFKLPISNSFISIPGMVPLSYFKEFEIVLESSLIKTFSYY